MQMDYAAKIQYALIYWYLILRDSDVANELKISLSRIEISQIQ